jgi:topoisomerase-4 subunit A
MVSTPSSVKFKDGDDLYLVEEVMSTDKLILMSSDGRAFTMAADKLPGGRGHGEPIRLTIDLEDSVDIVAMFRFEPERKRVMASSTGYGFVVDREGTGIQPQGRQVRRQHRQWHISSAARWWKAT